MKINKKRKDTNTMDRLTRRLIPVTALMTLFAAGTFYAQEHKEHGGASAKDGHAASEAPEIFCSHMGTGQLCPGNAQMFKLSAAQKERYTEALNNYNKTVEAASGCRRQSSHSQRAGSPWGSTQRSTRF